MDSPEYTKPIGTASDLVAPIVDIPEYTGRIGTASDQAAPIVDSPEYTKPIGTASDLVAPIVDIPEYTGRIGTASDQAAPIVDIPEYTGPIGTASDQAAPIVDIPEYTGPIGTASDQAAPIVDIPEYTGPIGTASDQAAPIISLPEFKLKALKDQATGVQVISGSNELGEASYLEIQKVDKQELLGKKYDAYDIQLKNENGQLIQAKGAVLVRLPISGTVQEFYRFSSEKDLKAQDFTIRDGMLEFLTIDLTTYAIVYKTETEVQQPSSSQIEEASPLANKNQLNGENSTNDKQLPATGGEASPLLFMASLSLALAAAFLLKGKKE